MDDSVEKSKQLSRKTQRLLERTVEQDRDIRELREELDQLKGH